MPRESAGTPTPASNQENEKGWGGEEEGEARAGVSAPVAMSLQEGKSALSRGGERGGEGRGEGMVE